MLDRKRKKARVGGLYLHWVQHGEKYILLEHFRQRIICLDSI